ncbi:MAG: hypothetical protein ACI97P_002624 [Arcticibacterium sp.]
MELFLFVRKGLFVLMLRITMHPEDFTVRSYGFSDQK